LNAGRDLEESENAYLTLHGRRREKACAPGVLGVCVAGDRASGYLVAKEMLFRKLDDENTCMILGNLKRRSWSRSTPWVSDPWDWAEDHHPGSKDRQCRQTPRLLFRHRKLLVLGHQRSVIELDFRRRIARWLQ
jgi:fumarate hydratase class I